jgi:putative hydrolase of the HAD superfamily
MLQAIFFDLDYTLYDQGQYLRGSLRSVARAVAEGCGMDAAVLSESLLDSWEALGTDCPSLFDKWLDRHELLEPARVKLCVDTFHAHRPASLALYPGVGEMLKELKGKYFLGLITDGDVRMQQQKVEALGLGACFDLVVYVKQWSLSKPDPEIYRRVLRQTGHSESEMIYLGDHPVKDIVGARSAGLSAIRVLTGEFKSLPDDPLYPPSLRLAHVCEFL